ncbi:isopentenyl-diphosphate Delta-isomerase [Candidatus Dependentiae bacterium]
MTEKDFVILVDENDQEIGAEEKLKAHEQGLLHRAFSVFLFRKKGDEIQLLLQQRAKHKYHCGGLWANTCCSHPKKGEDIIEAGKRRLLEEMGIQVEHLKEVGSFTYKVEFENGLTEHEIDHVLIGAFDADTHNFNPEEVAQVQWVSLKKLKHDVIETPEIFAPWFPKALSIIKKEVIANLFLQK